MGATTWAQCDSANRTHVRTLTSLRRHAESPAPSAEVSVMILCADQQPCDRVQGALTSLDIHRDLHSKTELRCLW